MNTKQTHKSKLPLYITSSAFLFVLVDLKEETHRAAQEEEIYCLFIEQLQEQI